jgi:small subunit ribosomal protein S7
MSRRRVQKKRQILPDVKYDSVLVAKFVNQIMERGKKSLARSIVYNSIEKAAEKAKMEPVELFEKVMDKVKPYVEVRSRRVGGATYQIPVEVKPERQIALAMRWLKAAATKRSEHSMADKLAAEMLEAIEGRGEAVKKCIDTKKMADANQAFAHFA